MITATTKQQHYLKQFAALQFPGSIETHGTIHVLEQQIPREAGDFYPIMEFIQNAGESLLADELFDRFKIKTSMMLHPKEIEALYRSHPIVMQYVACFDVIDCETGNLYSRIKVFCSGYAVPGATFRRRPFINRKTSKIKRRFLVSFFVVQKRNVKCAKKQEGRKCKIIHKR